MKILGIWPQFFWIMKCLAFTQMAREDLRKGDEEAKRDFEKI